MCFERSFVLLSIFSVGVLCTQQLHAVQRSTVRIESDGALVESAALLRRHAGTIPGAIDEDRSSSQDFQDFKVKYMKQYKDEREHQMRASIFHQRLSEINRHNAQPAHVLSWRAGVNKFTDWTDDELKVLNGYKRVWPSSNYASFLMNGGIPTTTQSRIIDAAGGFNPVSQSNSSLAEQPLRFNIPDFGFFQCVEKDQHCASPAFCCLGLVCGPLGLCTTPKDVPLAMDWSKQLKPGLEFKDQGFCGSCWAIAATNTIQLQAALLMNLSEVISGQDMLCETPNPHSCGGTGQCAGATPELGYTWATGSGMMATEDMAYKASCHDYSLVQKNRFPAEPMRPRLQIKGYHRIMFNNRVDIVMQSLVTSGPAAISVDASYWGMYKEGVFNSCPLNATVNHAVTLMGFGFATAKENGLAYWNILNSWGKGWGEEGYMRLERVAEGEPCGWDNSPEVGYGCKGGPKKLYVCGKCGMLSDISYPLDTHLAMTVS